MLERNFRHELIESAKKHGNVHIIDISDELKNVLGSLPPEIRKKISNRITKKPYDLAFFYSGRLYACELKLEKNYFSFNIKDIEEHQLKALEEVKNCGGYGFVIINFRKTLTTVNQRKYNIKERLLNRSYAIPIEFLINYNKYTISFKDLEKIDSIIKIPFNKEMSLWEIDKLFKCQMKMP